MTAYSKSLTSSLRYRCRYVLPSTIGSKVYYSNQDTPETWTLETARIKVTINDNLNGRTRILTLQLADSGNVKETIYTSYRRIKVVDNATGLTIFMGRVDITDPYWDDTYGQMLKVQCSDYSHELFVRKVDSNYAHTICFGTQKSGDAFTAGANYVMYSLWTCSAAATIAGLSFYTHRAGNVKGAIYAADGALLVPGTLLAYNNTGIACTAGVWNYMSLSLLDVTKDTIYWIALVSDSANCITQVLRSDTTCSGHSYQAFTYANSFPNPATGALTADLTYAECVCAVADSIIGNLKRSALIKKIADDYTNSTAPHTIDTHTYLTESGSRDTVNKNYTSSGRSPIDIIEELAKEDPWTDSDWNRSGNILTYHPPSYGDVTLDCDKDAGNWIPIQTAGTDYVLFGQNNPFLGITFDLVSGGSYTGIIWQYYNGSTWITITPTETYSFAANGSVQWDLPVDWATYTPTFYTAKYYIKMSVSTVVVDAHIKGVDCIQNFGYDYYVDDGQYLHYARRGSVNSGLTVSLFAAENSTTRSMMNDYSFCDQGREIITKAIVKGTSSQGVDVVKTSTNTALTTTYGLTKEKTEYVWGNNMTTEALNAYCQNRADALLSFQGGVVNRGEFTIGRYPYANRILTRVGSLIHIVCAPKSIDGYYSVLSVEYNEPDGLSKITCVSLNKGRSFSPIDGISNLSTMKYGNDAVTATSRVNDLNVSYDKLTDGDITATGTLTSGKLVAASGTITINYNGINISNAGTTKYINFSDGTTIYGYIWLDGFKHLQIESGVLTITGDTTLNLVSASGYVYIYGTYITMVNASCLYLEIPQGTADPTAPDGSLYFNTATGKFRARTGATWYNWGNLT